MYTLLSTCSFITHFLSVSAIFFFFNDTATTEIYTLSLHDALPISTRRVPTAHGHDCASHLWGAVPHQPQDRKSTRLNSSHVAISYAVFCLKKKKNKITTYETNGTND